MGKDKGNVRLITAALIAAVLMIVAAVFRESIQAGLSTFQQWIKGAGALGVAAFMLMYILATVAFIPGLILSIGAGLVWGVVWGSAIVSIASTLGATLACVFARGFLRRTIEQKLAGNEKFSAIDRAIGQSGWKLVFLLRLTPALPFNLMNYALGLTRVRLIHYITASWIGMFPGTVLYVYLGSLGNFFAEGREKTMPEKVFFAVGLLITLAVTVMITRIARKALEGKIGARETLSGEQAT